MLLMWSGGCDSTLILAEYLKAKQPVRTISVVHPRISAVKELRLARQRIINHFKRRGVSWVHREVVISFKDTKGFNESNGTQSAIWIPMSAGFLGETENLVIGFIKGDNAWHQVEAIRGAFGWLQNMCCRTGQLLFPTEWMEKAEVIQGLKRHNLYRKTWWCEGEGSSLPNGGMAKSGRPCGKCAPCITHKTALWQLKTKTNFALFGYGSPHRIPVGTQADVEEIKDKPA